MIIKTIPVDQNKILRYISMRYENPIGFEGISLMDENGDEFQKKEWSTRSSGDWSAPMEIPTGKALIGLKMS